MFENKPLKSQVQITFCLILLTSLIATIVTYVATGILFLTLQSNELLYPANHYEKQLPAIEEYIRQQSTALLSTSAKAGLEKVVPSEGIVYQVLDGDGRILYGTYRTKVVEDREQLYGRLNTTSGYQGKYVRTIPIIGNNARISGAVLLAYELKLTSPDSRYRQWVTGLFIPVVAAPFFYVVLFTILFSRKLTRSINRPLQVLMTAARKIGERDLNFTIDYHSKNEIGKLCDAFAEMQDALKDSLSAQWKIEQDRTEMVEALAHDLKTPMSVIQGYSEALLDSEPADREKRQRYLSVIRENAEKASSLVKQMQTSSELERSGLELHLREVNIKEFLMSKIQMYDIYGRQKRISITGDFDDTPDGLYRIDSEKLGRVLDNLLSNSLQYTPEGGRITVSAQAEQDRLRFTVADSGPGFRPKDMPHVFDRFYRGDTSRGNNKSHSGLGLSIARRLVEIQGGSIQASNGSPHGAQVTFTVKSQKV